MSQTLSIGGANGSWVTWQQAVEASLLFLSPPAAGSSPRVTGPGDGSPRRRDGVLTCYSGLSPHWPPQSCEPPLGQGGASSASRILPSSSSGRRALPSGRRGCTPQAPPRSLAPGEQRGACPAAPASPPRGGWCPGCELLQGSEPTSLPPCTDACWGPGLGLAGLGRRGTELSASFEMRGLSAPEERGCRQQKQAGTENTLEKTSANGVPCSFVTSEGVMTE